MKNNLLSAILLATFAAGLTSCYKSKPPYIPSKNWDTEDQGYGEHEDSYIAGDHICASLFIVDANHPVYVKWGGSDFPVRNPKLIFQDERTAMQYVEKQCEAQKEGM